MRQRSRSRSHTQQTTYAGAVTNIAENQQLETTSYPQNINETKTIITKIMTSIAYAHYMETIKSGTFQENINVMFRLNKLPQVKFAQNIFTEGIKELYRETMEENIDTNITHAQQPAKGKGKEKETEIQVTQENMETESNKRQRESLDSTTNENKGKKHREKQKNKQKHTWNRQVSHCNMRYLHQ